jgi:dTDP-4-dehydrorhamnose reductase
LLTGTSGQVGQALIKALAGGLNDNAKIIIPARAQMDLSHPELMRKTIREIKPDLIINPAAYTAVDKAETEPELAHLINAVAPGVMAEEAKRLGAALIHYSTDYVFDGSKRSPEGDMLAYVEDDTPCPVNVYGNSKLEGELAIRASGCDYLIFRTSWVYSEFGKNFLLTMLRLAKERDEIKVVDDQWGAPSSAIWLAQATAQVLSLWISAGAKQDWWNKNSGLYHLTPSGITSWCGFAEEIMRLAVARDMLGKPAPRMIGIPASEYPTPALRPMNSCLSTQLFTKQFGIVTPSWQNALADCMAR